MLWTSVLNRVGDQWSILFMPLESHVCDFKISSYDCKSFQPSPWSYKLRKKLTKKVRKRAQKAKAMVKKYKDQNGKTRVWRAYQLIISSMGFLVKSVNLFLVGFARNFLV